MSRKITIPYTPRPIWKKEIHPALDKYRFSVLVCHRRFGKTVGVINQLVKRAVQCQLPSPQYAYVAPFRTQAKLIAWSYLKYYTSVIPGIKVNESELYIELPTQYTNRQGARIYVKGADNPDALRGMYLDGVVLDEYAQMKGEMWNETIRPALADREGFAIFIGTPKGQNQFYEVYQKSIASDDWYTCLYTVEDTQVIASEELASMKADMTEEAIRQELYCDFTASATNVLIDIDLVNAAIAKNTPVGSINHAPAILGVDVARFGHDSSVIMRRQGLVAFEPLIYKKLDNMHIVDVVIHAINLHKPEAVFVDAGRGEGVIDRLRQLGYSIVEVNFGGKAALDHKYVNKRAEMWANMRQWLLDGGDLPQHTRLRAELSIPEYSFDNRGRIQLESKEKIKERVGYSPDVSDALALTFAHQVASKQQQGRNYNCKTDYDIFN